MMNAIDIKNATVRYGTYHALKNFNWQVKTGEHWFILGSNGAGKTTLVKMLMGMKWPLFGAEINVLGCRFGHANLVEMRKRIAWMSPFLLKWTSPETSSMEVIISGVDATMGMLRDPEPEEIGRAEKLMSEFNCLKLATHKFETLSSGEQLKVLICRALISSPELLIFDEACVHLDMKSREHLLDCINEMARRENSPTIVFITQRIEDITEVFTKGMIIKNGEILDVGLREDILTEDNLSRTFDMPLKLHKVLDNRLWATPY
jgi:iron complex transport system ATP-binding protein